MYFSEWCCPTCYLSYDENHGLGDVDRSVIVTRTTHCEARNYVATGTTHLDERTSGPPNMTCKDHPPWYNDHPPWHIDHPPWCKDQRPPTLIQEPPILKQVSRTTHLETRTIHLETGTTHIETGPPTLIQGPPNLAYKVHPPRYKFQRPSTLDHPPWDSRTTHLDAGPPAAAGQVHQLVISLLWGEEQPMVVLHVPRRLAEVSAEIITPLNSPLRTTPLR